MSNTEEKSFFKHNLKLFQFSFLPLPMELIFLTKILFDFLKSISNTIHLIFQQKNAFRVYNIPGINLDSGL